MFGRKYRLHMEENTYIFQYEGDTLPTPAEMSEYLRAFRVACSGSCVSVEGKISVIDSQRTGPRMGF